jgi:Lrp/AsnC family transcriptional regulator, leucine-responsive regulatory protein
MIGNVERLMSSEPQAPGLDDVDRRLLAELSDDPRLSKSELARRTGLSTPTASARVARLERLGVIRGYRLDVDPAALGFPVAAWVRVRPGPGQLAKVTELARATPEVAECHRITGDDCFVMRVHATGMGALEEVLDRFLLHGLTNTAIVVSSPVPARPLPVRRP